MGEMDRDMDAIVEILARELGQQAEYVKNVVQLLDEGNTIPFIARYRKELHGAMDDTTLRNLETKLRYLRSLQERREEVLRAMESQGKLTPALRRAVEAAGTLAEVEDLYRPYRPKRRTRATVAREKGLEPLAAELFRQDGRAPTLLAKGYINPELGVETVEEALAGASDILAEEISDDAAIRKDLRQLMARRAVLTSRAVSPETDSVYRLYYDFSCPAAQLQGHQILALNRGEKEGFLKLSLDLPGAQGAALVCRHALKPQKTVSAFVKAAAEDAYARLIAPAAERELRNDLTGRASEGAIQNFSLNLKPLLLQPPVKGAVTMGLDPGYRNGCKVAVVDPTGRVLDTAVVYLTGSQKKQEEARARLLSLIQTHGVRHIAIGNGTASRETEALTADLIRQMPEVSYMIVNEAGASVYSASPLAAEEFPEYDVNLRSAVSIARRLQDPLAELVKIEPQAIGVSASTEPPKSSAKEANCKVRAGRRMFRRPCRLRMVPELSPLARAKRTYSLSSTSTSFCRVWRAMFAKDMRLRVRAGKIRWWSRCQRVTSLLRTPMGVEKPRGNQPSPTENTSRNTSPSQKVGTLLRM